jgi:hypothetical protein
MVASVGAKAAGDVEQLESAKFLWELARLRPRTLNVWRTAFEFCLRILELGTAECYLSYSKWQPGLRDPFAEFFQFIDLG